MKSGLGTTLRILGVIGLVGAFILGRLMDKSIHEHAYYIIFITLGGIINLIVCFALAICTDAAAIYLKEKDDKSVRNQ